VLVERHHRKRGDKIQAFAERPGGRNRLKPFGDSATKSTPLMVGVK
jgi:hypothetical protein